jgi:hypothetical protein
VTAPARVRRVPQRTCVSCRTTTNKRELVRVVRAPDGHVGVDPTGKKAGRGAYVCSQPKCWENALKKGWLGRSLKTTIRSQDAAQLREYAESLVGSPS